MNRVRITQLVLSDRQELQSVLAQLLDDELNAVAFFVQAEIARRGRGRRLAPEAWVAEAAQNRRRGL